MVIAKEDDIKPSPDQGFWGYVRKQFWLHKPAVLSLYFIGASVVIALFADFIANEKPIYATIQDRSYFPVFRSYLVELNLAQWQQEFQNVEWKNIKYDFVIFPPVPYLPQNLDFNNSQSVSPLAIQLIPSNRWRHWLGTDELGHDVLSCLIHGTRIALSVGLVAVFISTIIGILLGAIAGHFGDHKVKFSLLRLIFNAVFTMLGLFYAFGSRVYVLSDAASHSFMNFLGELIISLLILGIIIYTGNRISFLFKKATFLSRQIKIPLDIIISRLIEVFVSIPLLLLIVFVIAVSKPSVYVVMCVIGFTSWTSTARFVRGEMLKVRSLGYIEATYALGYSEKRIMLWHALPNCLSPVLITAAFGIASAILIESGLSFLGIGVPAETITWGSLLSAARQDPSAWWLAMFPGFAIFLTVTAFNLIGEGLTDAMDPRLRK